MMQETDISAPIGNGNSENDFNFKMPPSNELAGLKSSTDEEKNPLGCTYNPELIYCGQCALSPEISTDLNKLQMNMLTILPPKKKGPKKKKITKHKMMFVSADTNIIEDGEEENIETRQEPETTDSSCSDIRKATLYISNLVKDSQVILIKSVLEPTHGVSLISTHLHDKNNVTKSKTVNITFDTLVVSLESLVKRLNELGLNASIKNSDERTLDKRTTSMCRSTLHVEGICCATEVPIVTHIIKGASRKVSRVSVNISARLVYVEHESLDFSIKEIAQELDQQGFSTTIKKDGNKKVLVPNNDESTALSSGQGDSRDDHIKIIPSKFVESTLIARSMICTEDINTIRKVFENCKFIPQQVRAFYPCIPSRTIKIEHDPKLVSALKVAEVLTELGGFTDVVVHIDGEIEGLTLPITGDETEEEEKGAYGNKRCQKIDKLMCYGLRLNIVLSGICWFISMLGEINKDWESLKFVGLFAVLFGMPPVALKAFRTLRRRYFDSNCMMLIAAVGALLLGEYEEAASVAFLFSISEYLEHQATKRARLALADIVNLRPEHANLIHSSSGEVTIVPACDLPVGSLVSVRTGDKIPADGIVIEGNSLIDESSLTGEARPIDKRINDNVSGGTINIGTTRIVVRTTVSAEDSAVSRLIRLVEEAQSNKSPTEKIVNLFARSYTPVVVCLAFLMCTIPWIQGIETGRYWTINGLIIIVIACPCALTISTPVTYAAGLAATAKKGILVKGGSRLEALGCVKTVFFDKTGTLTEGKFQLSNFETVGNYRNREEALKYLAMIEAPSSHPLAAALVKAAKMEGVRMPKDSSVFDHTILKGEGVTAIVEGEKMFVGNIRLFQRLGYYESLSESEKIDAAKWNEEGGTVGFLGIENIGIVAMYCVSDSIRKEAKHVVHSLQQDGIEVIMLTGDGDGAAKAVGKEVGIPEECIYSQFLPDDKLHHLASRQGFGSRKTINTCGTDNDLMLLCGDGVNDAPALSIADVGVAMGEGAALAMEMSDVTLMDSDLDKLLFSMKIGAKVIVTVQENIIFSIVSKVLVAILTFCGRMTLFGAIVSDVGVMLLVSLNGMKLLPHDRLLFMRKQKYDEVQTEWNEETEIV